ncbi:DNA polymerase II [Pinirhizobacter sp.]|jgi:DNA polymerase-2|uniref:DNA polymerase II n=1 Tax=Pinirhizobacter sp. TaxID=2950432 RepID=UPI002F424C62
MVGLLSYNCAVNDREDLGYILTRHWRDTRDGNDIELWLATAEGVRRVLITGQRSVAFVLAAQREQVERIIANLRGVDLATLPMKTFAQEPVLGLYTKGYRQMLALEKRLTEAGVVVLEADVRPDERYLMERFITASVALGVDLALERGTIVNPRLRAAAGYRPSLRLVSLDIETSAHGQLYSIALEGCDDRQVYMLGDSRAQVPPGLDFKLTYFDDRAGIIMALNNWFRHNDPDAIIGWNVVQFDLRLLQACADECGLVLSLGRGASPIEWRDHRRREGYLFASIPGRLVVDGIEALRTASWSFDSFSLENVARELLGEGKDIDDPYSRMEEIERRFHHDKPRLARYNLKDCELVTRIFHQTKLMDFLLERANTTGLQADRSGGSIAAFSHLYLPRMHRQGYVAPNVASRLGESYPGGFVMDSRPGIYDSVLVLDYKSLYPSIIRTYLVDPVGMAEGGLSSDPSATIPGPNGTRFSRSKHCLPDLIAQMWSDRDKAKKEGNGPLSQALKLLMNAFIGVLGASGGRFFDPKLVSAVTLRGHEIMRQTRTWVEGRGYAAIYGDTDSIFVWLGRRYSEEEAGRIGGELVHFINASWRELLWNSLAIECHLEIEFDTHYQRFFMPTTRNSDQGSKKRYAGLAIDSNGHEQMVFRGLETVRSDWTLLAKRFQGGLLERIFKGEPYADFVREYVRDLRSGRMDDALVYRKRLRGRLDSYDRATPPHVRAAILADENNVRLGRPRQYQGGGWISYVMTTNGPEPLEARRSTLDYDHYLLHQLRPVGDAILAQMGDRFDALSSHQPELF